MFLKSAKLVVLVVMMATSACTLGPLFRPREIRQARFISNFTLDGDAIYFGAGYQLYRVSLPTRSIEAIYTTNRIKVEQPIIADGVAYFGGRSYVNENGNRGEDHGFFAVDLQSRQKLWKFPLGVNGYSTFGTYPVVVDDRILVCARQHLHCLDRSNGKELWKVDNWFGQDSDGTTVPYAHNGFVYFMIREEYFTGKDSYDGHWAKVALSDGSRKDILIIADKPGTYHDNNGNAIGILTDGVVYGATRYDPDTYPSSRFGALDLEAKQFIWEGKGSRVRTKPAISKRTVFTFRDNSLQALDRKTGSVVWNKPLENVVHKDAQTLDRRSGDYEYERSRRVTANDEVVVVQGSQGLVALKIETGKELWSVPLKSEMGDADPLIVDGMLIVSSVRECSIVVLDLTNGRELWRLKVPVCQYYYLLDD